MTDSDPDARLLEELGSVLRKVGPPASVTDFANAAIDLRRLDTELAELLADSALEAGGAVTVRSGGSAARSLTFRAAELSIDVKIQYDAGAYLVLGQLGPAPAGATVDVQAADATVIATTEADALGRFRLRLEATGRIRLAVVKHDPTGPPVMTSWVVL